MTKPFVLSRTYLPEDTILEKEHVHGVPYRSWAKAGWVTLTPGNVTDFDYIRRDILEMAKTCQVEQVTFDRYFSGELVADLQKEGIKCEGFAQNTVAMNAPTLELERLIISKGITFERNKLLSWCAGNVVLFRDSSGNVKPNKDRAADKIDPIVALIMAFGRHLILETERKTKTEFAPRVRRLTIA